MTHLEYAPAHGFVLGHGNIVEALVEDRFVVVHVMDGHQNGGGRGERRDSSILGDHRELRHRLRLAVDVGSSGDQPSLRVDLEPLGMGLGCLSQGIAESRFRPSSRSWART